MAFLNFECFYRDLCAARIEMEGAVYSNGDGQRYGGDKP